jgi:flagellar biosynthesis/type III secretory pathway protein FliH
VKAKQVARLFFLVKHKPELERTFKHWVEYNLATRLVNPQAFKKAANLEEMAVMLEENVDTWVTQWKNKGLQEGLQEGLQKGLQEGLLKGEALFLKRQLRKRFGTLPEWVENKLNQASSAQLEQWVETILDAQTLDAVFEP